MPIVTSFYEFFMENYRKNLWRSTYLFNRDRVIFIWILHSFYVCLLTRPRSIYINVIVCILIILYVFVFLFFFSIVIGNKLIKRNYLINFFYYRLITKCNIILINWFNYRPVWRTWYNHGLVLLYLTLTISIHGSLNRTITLSSLVTSYFGGKFFCLLS